MYSSSLLIAVRKMIGMYFVRSRDLMSREAVRRMIAEKGADFLLADARAH